MRYPCLAQMLVAAGEGYGCGETVGCVEDVVEDRSGEGGECCHDWAELRGSVGQWMRMENSVERALERQGGTFKQA